MPQAAVARELSPLGWLRRIAVIGFVCWHLLMMFVTNAKIKNDFTDETIRKYERYLSLDQAWGMFTSPLFRSLPFPAVRITFSDGSSELVRSTNEPDDLSRFVRIGGWRLRKLEHTFVTERIQLEGDYRQPIQRRLAQSYLARWRQAHPDDPRTPVRLTLVKREFTIPQPGESWPTQPMATETELLSMPVEALK